MNTKINNGDIITFPVGAKVHVAGLGGRVTVTLDETGAGDYVVCQTSTSFQTKRSAVHCKRRTTCLWFYTDEKVAEEMVVTPVSDQTMVPGNVYEDIETGERFVCASLPDDEDECLVVNFDGTTGYALPSLKYYHHVSGSLNEII